MQIKAGHYEQATEVHRQINAKRYVEYRSPVTLEGVQDVIHEACILFVPATLRTHIIVERHLVKYQLKVITTLRSLNPPTR